MKRTRNLILYSSPYGQTAKIAHSLADQISDLGFPTDAFPIELSSKVSLENYTAILVGVSVYREKTSGALQKWVKKNRNAIESLKNGIFLVSFNATKENILKKWIQKTGWQPQVTASFQGALNYTEYSFWIRTLLKRASAKAGGPIDTSKNFELTDWIQVSEFAKQFADLIRLSQKREYQERPLHLPSL